MGEVLMSGLATRMEDYMEVCSHCGLEERCRIRTFSEKGRLALLKWKEAEVQALDSAMCNECYSELRGILADRVDEL